MLMLRAGRRESSRRYPPDHSPSSEGRVVAPFLLHVGMFIDGSLSSDTDPLIARI
jgi:hypothetical protein